MDTRYNVYFAGQLQEGQDIPAVRQRLGKLFNADQQTLDRLFSGTPQLLKRECDKATALKYKQAMEKAGALPVIKAAEQPATEPAAPASAAAKIAALAAAPDEEGYRGTTQSTPAAAEDAMLAPAGADVLRPEERREQVSRDIDTLSLSAGNVGERLSEPAPESPPAPDTSHLSTAEVGDDIPTLPDQRPQLDPDTSALDLSPAGTDFSDCAPPEAQAPELDLSGLDIAEAGSDVLEEAYRRREEAQAPDTSHLSVEE